MSIDEVVSDSDRKKNRYHFDRHTPEYRTQFEKITEEIHAKCPVAWTDTYEGHWVAGGSQAVFELARCPVVSNDHDINGERQGYQGISIPKAKRASGVRGGILEMDEPEHRIYRTVLNPYLSPAAVKRWVPFIDEVTRACLDEKIEQGRIDFVDDLANIVPAVLTLAMLGIPLKNWAIYSEPVHASVYTPEHSPDIDKIVAMHRQMGLDLLNNMIEIRENPRPGIVNGLHSAADRRRTRARPRDHGQPRTGHRWRVRHHYRADRALDGVAVAASRSSASGSAASGTPCSTPLPKSFCAYFTPAPGDGRTFSDDVELEGTQFKEGERLWISWAMANRDPSVFHEPNNIIMDRKGNRHFSFGLGVHRCIGSNVARTVFKSMLTAVLDRMPDYECDPEGTVHYETIGVIQGMRNLPATFTPGSRLGAGLDETLEKLQRICDEQELALPITERKEAAVID